MNGRQATFGDSSAIRVSVNHRCHMGNRSLRGLLLAARDTTTGHCAQRNRQLEQKSWACHEFEHIRLNHPSGPAEALPAYRFAAQLFPRPYCRADIPPPWWSIRSAQVDPRILDNCFIRRKTQNHNSTFWTQMRFIPEEQSLRLQNRYQRGHLPHDQSKQTNYTAQPTLAICDSLHNTKDRQKETVAQKGGDREVSEHFMRRICR